MQEIGRLPMGPTPNHRTLHEKATENSDVGAGGELRGERGVGAEIRPFRLKLTRYQRIVWASCFFMDAPRIG
jgi:hypothetical protein